MPADVMVDLHAQHTIAAPAFIPPGEQAAADTPAAVEAPAMIPPAYTDPRAAPPQPAPPQPAHAPHA